MDQGGGCSYCKDIEIRPVPAEKVNDIEEEWEVSPERYGAYITWSIFNKEGKFEFSQEFKNGRYAFRRRMNNSPWNETT